MTVYKKTYESPPIDEKEILRDAGVAKNAESNDIAPLLSECLKEALPLITYRLCYAEYPIKAEGETLDLTFIQTKSKSLQKNLENCHSVILFAATLGISLDRLIYKYSHISPAKALLFQAIGAERIEAICEAFMRELEAEKSAKGEKIRPRFSCGFGDFPLSAQKDIFGALGCQKLLGISLGENLIMSPTKSVTAIVGISKT